MDTTMCTVYKCSFLCWLRLLNFCLYILSLAECPECNSVYMLDRGGCLHFICNKCKFEFCGSCSKPFHKPSKNPCNTCSTSKGLHAHHPRNCPFYTRDIYRNNIDKLKNLLEVSCPSTGAVGFIYKCSVMLLI